MKHTDKIPCPASPYSIRHEVGVMTGFIALFIIASVAYGIASKSESWIIDYSFSEIFAFCTLPHRGRLLIPGAKKRERERGLGGEGGQTIVCLGIRGYTYENAVLEGFEAGGLADGLDALHTITNNLSSPVSLYPHLHLILLQTLSHCTQKLTSLDSRKRTQPSTRTRPTN